MPLYSSACFSCLPFFVVTLGVPESLLQPAFMQPTVTDGKCVCETPEDDVKSRAVAPVREDIVYQKYEWRLLRGPVPQDVDMRLRVLDGVLNFFKMDLLEVISWTVVLTTFVDSVTTRLSIWRILYRATTGRPSVRSTFIFLNSFFFWWNCTLNKFCLTHVVLLV